MHLALPRVAQWSHADDSQCGIILVLVIKKETRDLLQIQLAGLVSPLWTGQQDP